jgi:E3 ubiquitin-protein ligase HERC2
MFQFLGVLMGIAIRTGSPLSLNLAEPTWKALVIVFVKLYYLSI